MTTMNRGREIRGRGKQKRVSPLNSPRRRRPLHDTLESSVKNAGSQSVGRGNMEKQMHVAIQDHAGGSTPRSDNQFKIS